MKKGNTLLLKASPLKLSKSFYMMLSMLYQLRNDAQHRGAPFPAETLLSKTTERLSSEPRCYSQLPLQR